MSQYVSFEVKDLKNLVPSSARDILAKLDCFTDENKKAYIWDMILAISVYIIDLANLMSHDADEYNSHPVEDVVNGALQTIIKDAAIRYDCTTSDVLSRFARECTPSSSSDIIH